MKKKYVRLLAMALAVAMLLCACGSSSSGSSSSGSSSAEINMDTSENAITDLVTYETIAREIEDFCIQHSQSATDFYVTANLVSGLCATDSSGQLTPAIATSWESNEDSTVWTFHLRDDVTWVDVNGNYMADLNANDFIAGLEWVLNAAKNEASNTSMPIEMIAGAGDYYDLTSEMDEAEAAALSWDNETFLNTVGIRAVDDYTIEYTMLAPKPYFDTVATYACLYPASPVQLESMTPEEYLAIDNTTMWYCGPYLLTEYINGNEKVFEANPSWFGNDDHTRFQSVTVKMVESQDTAFTLFQSGDIDNVSLNESTLATITEGTEYYDNLVETLKSKYSYQIHFCYDKNNEDGTPDVNWNTAIANEAFRLSWYYGLDFTPYFQRTNATNPLKCENDFYTMSGLCYTSSGVDYTTLVEEKLDLKDYDGVNVRRTNADLAQQYKEEAIEELTAQGVTFPVEIDYYIASGDQTALDTANVLKDIFHSCLGEDYVSFNICTYVSSLSQEVRIPKLGAIYINGWGADYGDPKNYLGQEVFGDDNAYYSVNYSCINDFYGDDGVEPYSDELIATYEEYTEMVEAADAIVDDLDARYEAFAEAEAYFVQHALTLPLYYSIQWQLTNINDYSKSNPMFGVVADHYYVDWETNSNGYTTEDYEAFAS